jgi:putative transposase
VFFGDDDYRAYLALIASAARHAGAAIWSYCLMPNHVHFIIVPGHEDALRATFAEAHRRYTARIHAREQWTGHLWQGRFSSTAMDGPHLMAAARYVALNPVRAGLVAQAADWPWSSARAYLAGRDDGVVTVGPVLDMIGDFAAYLGAPEDAAAVNAIRRSRTTGRPVGGAAWLRPWKLARSASWRRASAGRRRGRSWVMGRGSYFVQCHRNLTVLLRCDLRSGRALKGTTKDTKNTKARDARR